MRDVPMITVVIATYNQSRYLGAAIESVLAQTYPEVEVIVVDDGSTDDTPSVVSRYEDRIHYVRQPNAERGAARNHGLRLARGALISFLDSDDVWLPHKLESEARLLLASDDLALVYSDSDLIDAGGRRIGSSRRISHNGRVTAALIRNNFITLSAMLARTDCIRAVGGFREDRVLAGSEDWELWVRLSLRWPVAHVPEITTLYRVSGENTTADPRNLERSMESAIRFAENDRSLTSSELRTMRGSAAMANAVNYGSAGARLRAVKWLIATARYDIGRVFEYGYVRATVRLIVPTRVLQQLRDIRMRRAARFNS